MMTTSSPTGFVSLRYSMASMTLSSSSPGRSSFLGAEPVATMISSNSLRSSAFASVLSLISTLSFCIWCLYQSSSILSFSLKKGAAAAMNTPPSSPVFSKSVTLCPLRVSMRAASMPPTPPPTMAMFFFVPASVRSHSVSSIAVGLTAQ